MGMGLALASTLLLSRVGVAQQTLYDNLPPTAPNVGSDSVNSFGPLYDSFSTGFSAQPLTDVKILLGNRIAGVGTTNVGLYADNATNPGSLLASLGTVSDALVTTSQSIFDIPVGSPVALALNTRYWIGLSTSDGSTTEWGWTLVTTGTGVPSEFFANANGTSPNTFGPYQMQVNVGAASTPEPGTYGFLLSAGLTAALALRRRRRKSI